MLVFTDKINTCKYFRVKIIMTVFQNNSSSIFPAIYHNKSKRYFLQVIIGFDFQQAQRRADHAQRRGDDRQESGRARRRHGSPYDVTQRHATGRVPRSRV